MIKFSLGGSTVKTRTFLQKMQSNDIYSNLSSIAQRGVVALQANTPVDSGLTAESWGYLIEIENDAVRVIWTNTNTVDGVNIAIILQYGHATGTGGYVTGRDYINPALEPIFDEIADDVWEKVTNA